MSLDVPEHNLVSTRLRVLEALRQRAAAHYALSKTPFVTVTYAQSLDGTIAGNRGEPLQISCKESLVYTHALRACHDAILVGIETIFSDDPQLTTRHIAGNSPQPVILDSQLRIPLSARIFEVHRNAKPIVVCCESVSGAKKSSLEKKGVDVVIMPADLHGRVSLPHMLRYLGEKGIESLMVEGGARVITSFLETQLADHLIITVSMKLIGGKNVVQFPEHIEGFGDEGIQLKVTDVHHAGEDLLIHADVNGSKNDRP